MAKKFKDLAKACWKGYKAVGLKDKDGKKVPNCVPESVELTEEMHELGIDHRYEKDKAKQKHVYTVLSKHGAKASAAGDKETYFHVHKDKVEAAKKELRAGGVHATHWINGEWKEETILEADQIQSADYKLAKDGKKVRAKHIVFHNQDDDEEKEKEMKESTAVAPSLHVHRVAVTVSDPDHPMVSKRDEKYQKFIRINDHRSDKDVAVDRAKKHYAKKGYKVHGAEHAGMVYEETIQEASYKGDGKVETKKYSWGTMKTVHHGSDFSIPLHPEHHEAIAKLKDEQEHHFKDETGRSWTARRKGDDVHFQGANGGNSTKVKHSALKEEVEQIAEVSRKTLGDYIKSASQDKMMAANNLGVQGSKLSIPDAQKLIGKINKRTAGIDKSVNRLTKEEVETLEEANHREFAAQGKMHPDMAKHMEAGREMDFYAHGTGDKLSGKVIKNDGKSVHVKVTHNPYKEKDSSVHKFSVTDKLDEGYDSPLDTPEAKKAREELKKTLLDIKKKNPNHPAVQDVKEEVRKSDIPAYLRKKNGDKPLTVADVKAPRKDSISAAQNLAKQRNEDFENGEVETSMKSYKEFVQSLNEYNSADGVYRHKGNYGGSHQETDEDDEDKPKSKPASTEKRGRGRPKGSSSGARQQGSASGSKANGADYTGYKLHLPNTK